MEYEEEYGQIVAHLQGLANPEIAAHSQRFFKTGEGEYGYGDKFLGIRVPLTRQAVRKFQAVPVSIAAKLIKSEYHEVRLFALLLLGFHFPRSDAKKQKAIYHLYMSNIRYVNNWDLVDSSAPHIAGAYLEDKCRSVLYELAQSDSLWERRIAVISTFHFIRNHQFEDTLGISDQLLNDPEDLIQKAVGWMLREVGNRDLTAEVAFLKNRYRKMPRVMLRYAIEKFSKEERQEYLQGLV
ncbi:MAG: DNA alkylation repair protein [Gemmatimonadales bacterium]|nr:DNA alkylation repair protein [Gemmatimonadales bacterium]